MGGRRRSVPPVMVRSSEPHGPVSGWECRCGERRGTDGLPRGTTGAALGASCSRKPYHGFPRSRCRDHAAAAAALRGGGSRTAPQAAHPRAARVSYVGVGVNHGGCSGGLLVLRLDPRLPFPIRSRRDHGSGLRRAGHGEKRSVPVARQRRTLLVSRSQL